MKWFLDPKDIVSGWCSSSSGGTFARKTKVTSRRMWLLHQPTNLKVEGVIKPGNYSKKEMQKLTKELEARLFKELEQKVAKHLRLPGR